MTVPPGLIGPFPLTSLLWSHWHSSWSPLPQRNHRLLGKEYCKPQRVCRQATKICSDPLLVVSLRRKLMLQAVFPWGDVNTVYPLFLRFQWETKIWFTDICPGKLMSLLGFTYVTWASEFVFVNLHKPRCTWESRTCFHPICPWVIFFFFWLLIDVRGSSPLWAVSPQAVGLGYVRKAAERAWGSKLVRSIPLLVSASNSCQEYLCQFSSVIHNNL